LCGWLGLEREKAGRMKKSSLISGAGSLPSRAGERKSRKNEEIFSIFRSRNAFGSSSREKKREERRNLLHFSERKRFWLEPQREKKRKRRNLSPFPLKEVND